MTCRVGFTRSRRIDLVRSVRVTRVRRERRREMNTEKENGRIENIGREERDSRVRDGRRRGIAHLITNSIKMNAS